MVHVRVRTRRRHSLLFRLLSLLFGLLSMAIILVWVLSGKFYEGVFSERFTTDPVFKFEVEEFDGLQRTRYEFPSDQGQKLVGYLYYTEEAPRGMIVFSHDLMCGGHNVYMDYANYFAQNGFHVFAFDGTGNDESEGNGILGLPQGQIDLDYAIRFVENSGEFPELPIGLFGHGWGGYNVCAVLEKHPEVKAVVACSAYNKPTDMVRRLIGNAAGGWTHVVMPFFKLHQWKQYKGEASLSAMDGFEASEAAVMILHSSDDELAPMDCGYDEFYEEYMEDSRFSFLLYEDRKHDVCVYNPYLNQLHEAFVSWRNGLDYDYKAEENAMRYQSEENSFWETHLDRQQLLNRLDKDLLGKLLNFYSENLR